MVVIGDIIDLFIQLLVWGKMLVGVCIDQMVWGVVGIMLGCFVNIFLISIVVGEVQCFGCILGDFKFVIVVGLFVGVLVGFFGCGNRIGCQLDDVGYLVSKKI